MAQIDDVINSLSSDELDTLNSDPQMLVQFKAKYAPQPTGQGSSDMDVAKAVASNMPGLLGHLGREVSNIPSDVMNNVKGLGTAAAMGIYGIADPINAAKDLAEASPDIVSGIKQSAKDFIKHPINTMEQAPVSTALSIGGLSSLTPEAGGIEGELGSFIDDLKGDSSLSKFNKKLLGVSESATKMGGADLPTPSQEDIDTAVGNVIQAHKDVVNAFGEDLNEAKSNVGLPTTKEEISNSIRKYGNNYNLDLDKPLGMPDNMKKRAPTMEETDTGPTTGNIPQAFAPGQIEAYIKGTMGGGLSPNTGQPLPKVNIWGVRGDPDEIAKLGFGNDPASIPEEVIKDKGIPIAGKQTNITPMPYKLGDTSNAQNLNTEIGRFLQNQDYINNPNKIKAASYLQDQIKNYVDFDKPGDTTQGLLKSKYQQLKEVISQSSPELQAAKDNFGHMTDALDLVSNNLDEDRPGKTQDYLRRVFTSDTQAANDQRQQLAYLEQLSGKPVISDLFKQFAGKEFGQFVGPTGERLIKRSLPYAVGGALFGHPALGLGGVAAEGALTSPKLIGTLQSATPPLAANLGAGAALQGFKMMNVPQLQSLRDRLKNESNQQSQ